MNYMFEPSIRRKQLPFFSFSVFKTYFHLFFIVVSVTLTLQLQADIPSNEMLAPPFIIEKNNDSLISQAEQQIEHTEKKSIELVKNKLLEPIAIYLTWEKSPSRSMTIRWITQETVEEEILQTEDKQLHTNTTHHKKFTESPYRLLLVESSKLEPSISSEKDSNSLKNVDWQHHTAITLPFPEKNPYLIHSVLLDNLLPDTEYYFRIEGTDVEHRFSTVPEKIVDPIIFVTGGDCNQTESYFKETTAEACRTSPLFTLIGGDLSYATPSKKNKPEDCDRWIKWLITWYQEMQEKSVTSKPSRLIPLIVAIGNHEVKGRYGQTAENASFFYTLFRYPYLTKSYYSLRFGDYLSLYILDSGHTTPISGEQKEWLQTEMKRDALIHHKIATYHVPAYPSVRYYRNTLSAQIRRHWIPIFDKERLHLAFENHDHAYKRTFPLKDSKLHPRGVVYVGDGSWGAKERLPKKANRTTYLATTAKVRQFCKISLTYDKRDVIAISSKGAYIDQYSEEVDEILAQKTKLNEQLDHGEGVESTLPPPPAQNT